MICSESGPGPVEWKAVVGLNIRIRHVAAWIACFAVLLAALAPTVSRILAASCIPPSITADVCFSGGTVAVLDADHSDHHSSEPAKKELHFEHCPFCLTHAGSFGLTPIDGLALPAFDGDHVLPSLFYQSLHPLFVWVTPHSRAPPAYS